MKKKPSKKKSTEKKSSWKTPKLIVLSDTEFSPEPAQSVYAQYGGGTVTHQAGGRRNSVTTECM